MYVVFFNKIPNKRIYKFYYKNLENIKSQTTIDCILDRFYYYIRCVDLVSKKKTKEKIF